MTMPLGDKALAFDHVHCHSEQSTGLEEYSLQIDFVMTLFTGQMRKSSQDKVIIMYGRRVQRWFMRDPNPWNHNLAPPGTGLKARIGRQDEV